MNIKDKVEEIIEEYYNGNYYSSSREDEEENEIEMKDELKEFLEDQKVQHEVIFQGGFDSCGYSCDSLFVTWINHEGKLEATAVLIECM
jgi:hypothetical protein